MPKFLVFVCMIVLIPLQIVAQQDPEAKKILDRFADKAESAYPFRIDFQYVYESQMDDISESKQGYIVLDNKRFILILPEMDIYCDGSTFWNYLVESNEVYLSDPEDAGEDDFLLSNPGKIFTLYHENFKFRLKGEAEHDGTGVYEIDLHPYELERAYHTVKLLINRSNYLLYSVQTLEKQGTSHTITVTDFQARIKTDDDLYTFRPENHQDVVVVDTRL